jgi:hypothetical protein
MTDHVTVPVIGTVLPPASLPEAVYVSEVLTCMVPGFGVTTMLASGPAVTIAVAVPESVPLVALTVLVKVPVVEPAVKGTVSPVAPAGTVPPPATTDQVTLPVIGTVLPSASLPDAVYVSAVLIGMVPGFGVTTMDASGPAVTVTVAVPVTLLQSTEIIDVPGVLGAVKSPVWVIVPPPETDQTGVFFGRVLPSLSVITTVNCWVPPTATLAGFGETTTDAIVRGPLESPHAAMNRPATMTATRTPAMRARRASPCRVRLLMMLYIELLLT